MRTMTLACAVAAVALGISGPLLSQSPADRAAFYGVLDTSQDAAVKQWSTYLWNRIETGSPSVAAAAFAFTDPALASPLFQPLRAAKGTLEGLEVAAESPCYWVATTPTGDLIAIGDAALIQATKDYMTLGKLSTDLGENIAGTSEHLNKILSSDGAQFGFEGGSLVSYGVQPDTVAAAYVGGAPKFDVGPGTMNAIGVILGTAPAIAASANSPSESLRAIRGGASRTDDFLTQLALALWDVDVNQVVMTRVDAMFGAYGDLPLALVQFEDAYVLVDTVNGTLAGPFEPTSPFDATSLLANHPDAYEPDSHILYVDDKGCTADAPNRRRPNLRFAVFRSEPFPVPRLYTAGSSCKSLAPVESEMYAADTLSIRHSCRTPCASHSRSVLGDRSALTVVPGTHPLTRTSPAIRAIPLMRARGPLSSAAERESMSALSTTAFRR